MQNLISNIQKNRSVSRNSNLELYRIIVMILIIAHHYVVNSGLIASTGPIYSNVLSVPSQFLLLFGAWGKTGINCFVLITGYFMCKSQITAKKFAKLLFEIIFYRVVIGVIFGITGYAPFNLKIIIKMLLPVTSVHHNFTGCFLIFFLCIPFLNKLIHNLNEKQHIYLILISLFTYVFFGTVPIASLAMNYVSWFMVLFFIASYVRIYPKRIFENKKFWGIMTLASVLVSSISIVACSWLSAKMGARLSYYFVTDSNTFLAVLTGVCSFMYFKNINIKPSRVINTISATTFGVFLIHANSTAMRQWLWVDVLDNVGMYGSPLMPVHAVVSVIVVFIICSLIDMLRIRFIEKPFFEFWDKHWDKFCHKFITLENKMCERLKIGHSQD